MDVISKLSVITPEKIFYGSPRKKKIQISQNELLCMKFYLCFHNPGFELGFDHWGTICPLG